MSGFIVHIILICGCSVFLIFFLQSAVIPGPPFLFGACAVLLAFLVALFIPEHSKAANTRKHSNSINSIQSNSPDRGSDEDIEPLLQDSSVWKEFSSKINRDSHWADIIHALSSESRAVLFWSELLICQKLCTFHSPKISCISGHWYSIKADCNHLLWIFCRTVQSKFFFLYPCNYCWTQHWTENVELQYLGKDDLQM